MKPWTVVALPLPIAPPANADTTHPFAQVRTSELTKRELEVLSLVSSGLMSKEIAERLVVSSRTVDYHLARLYRKLQVSNRLEATREAVRRGLACDSV